MPTCIICRQATILDDVVVAGVAHTCICLRCHERDSGTALPIAKTLRKAVCAAMGAVQDTGPAPRALATARRVAARRPWGK